MNRKLKLILISFFIGGGIFALLQAGMDAQENIAFDLWKFLFRMAIFGFFMAAVFLLTQRYERSS